MTLVLNLKTKFVALLTLLCFVSTAAADPEVNGELLPPGEASYITDPAILKMLNLGPDGDPVWCYSNLANSLIISSADREREKCTLKLNQELQRERIDCDFKTQQLNIEITSLKEKHKQLISLKNHQIDELTQAALKRPNDYSLWWGAGGVAVGVLTSIAIMFAVNK